MRLLAWKELELIGVTMRYRLDMLEVSECKINGNGMKTVEGVISVYSGVQEGRAKAGVGGGSICPGGRGKYFLLLHLFAFCPHFRMS